MKTLFFILSFLILSCSAHELDSLIQKLKTDDFEAREAASLELEIAGEKHLQWLIEKHILLLKEDMEASSRVLVAAEKIFYKTELKNTLEYKWLFGDSGLETYDLRVIKVDGALSPDEVDSLFRNSKESGVKVVSAVKEGFDVFGKVQKGDVIQCMLSLEEGNPLSVQGFTFIGNEPVKYRIKRFDNLDSSLNDEEFREAVKNKIVQDSKDFKMLDVEAMNGWKDVSNFSKEDMDRIKTRRWIIYLAEKTRKKDDGESRAEVIDIKD